LRHGATSRKVADSIPDYVIGILSVILPIASATTRKEWRPVRTVGLTTQPYHLRVPTVLQSGSLKLLEPSGTGIVLTFYHITAI